MRQRVGRFLISDTATRLMLPHRTAWQFFQRRRSPPRLENVRSVLVVRLDEIGDLVLTSAFLRELRHNASGARITLAVKPACREFAEACPHVDEVITTSAPSLAWTPSAILRQHGAMLRENVRWTLSRAHDLVLLPRRNADYYAGGFFAFTRGLSYVAGLRDDAIAANRLGRYYPGLQDVRFPVTDTGHESDYGLKLLEALGGKVRHRHLEAWTTPADRSWARNLVATRFLSGRPLAVLHPSGGNSPLKQWPVENFLEVTRQLSTDARLQWLVIGGPDESWINGRFAEGDVPRVVNLAGRLSLRQLAALMHEADLFVGGDSGPMHLAAAAGTPVVAIFGSTSETRFRPLGQRVKVVSLRFPCSPDGSRTFDDRCKRCIYPAPRCLLELPVALVVDAARELLAAPVRAAVAGFTPGPLSR